MRCLVLVAVLVAVVAGDHYPGTHDDLDLEKAFRSKEVLLTYFDCFLDRKPCNDTSAFFKKYTGEVVKDACTKCNLSQKRIMKTFLEQGKIHLPEDMKAYFKKYDPHGIYHGALMKELETISL